MTRSLNTGTFKYRIRRDIEKKLVSGEWPPGYRIPSEHDLMEQYGCSRMTVNKVLSALSEGGALVRRRKAGTFVARPNPRIESAAMDIPNIPEEVTSRGHTYSSRQIARYKRAALESVPHEMDLAYKGEVLALEYLHEADNRPFAYEERLISLRAVPEAMDVDFGDMPPGSWLLQRIPWSRARHRITAINADKDLARHLGVSKGTACLLLERKTWLGKQAITYVKQAFVGDSYELLGHFVPGSKTAHADGM